MTAYTQIGLGTAAIGRPQYINIRQDKGQQQSLEEFKHQGSNLLKAAYDLGIRYFDTAPGYGMAEQLITDWWLQDQPLNMNIATKWGYTYTANFDPNAQVHEVKEHSLSKLNEQWEVSKDLLPALQYYQIHSATFETQVINNEEVLNRLAELKQEHGLTIGLTTTGDNQVDVFKQAISIERNGQRLFDLFQVTYNIFDQSFGPLLNSLNDPSIKIVVKEALANGRIFPSDNYPHYAAAYASLSSLAEKYRVGIDAVALRFCLDSLPVFKVLSGAARLEHLQSNLKAADFVLDQQDLDQLRSLAVPPIQYWKERKQLAWN